MKKWEESDSVNESHLLKFCEVVRDRRLQLGLSQEELGLRARLQRTYISDIETSLRDNLSMKSLHRLAFALEMTPATLLRTVEIASAADSYGLDEEGQPDPVRPAKFFYEVVRGRREQLGLSQQELGRRAKLHRTYVSEIENGVRDNLSMKLLYRLASALELTAAMLLLKVESACRSTDLQLIGTASRKK
jgi:transcriptional regulator with XRE-family HTH domain